MSRRVHFDVDPGCDDAVMLAMALGHDEIDVAGLSTVAGNSTVENTTRNAVGILEALGRTEVPVARGCGRPFVDDLTTAEWVHGEHGIRGGIPRPTDGVRDTHGADFIVEQAREHGPELTVAAVGPLTNFGLALAKEPALADLVDEIYLMGGAALTIGNATPMAEANFHNDPHAASRVMQEAAPRMVGLDVTNRATVAPERIDEYRAAGGFLETVAAWLDYPEEVINVGGGTGPAIHDAVVVADLIDSDVLTFEDYPVEIDTTGGPSHGAVVCDKHGVLDRPANASVAVDIDVDRYRELLTAGVEACAA
ncbi:MAG: nucleoside hydrolase [Halobacteriales archaeon]